MPESKKTEKQHNRNRLKRIPFVCRVCCAAGPILLILAGLGCNTPFLATDNEFLLKFPGTERRSDKVEGVLRPWERRERIEEKGIKGASAKPREKQILAFQLIEEYKRANDPTIRRSAVEALAKITASADIRPAMSLYAEALHDSFLGVRVSAVDALGSYTLKIPKKDRNPEVRAEALKLLDTRYRELAYSIDAGETKENDERKDMRLAIVRAYSQFEESPELLTALGEALDGEKLDDGALRAASMKALAQVTKKSYALDYSLWRGYLDYRSGKIAQEPKEVSPLSAISLDGMNPLK